MIPLLLVVSLVLQQPQPPRPAVTGPAPTAAMLAADTGVLRHANGRPAPYAEALRVAGTRPRIDGDLGDAAWVPARPITDFTQNTPHDGEPASERTEVRIVYDDAAIYLAARMFDAEPALVRAQLGRRDSDPPADEFRVDFDSYHDHLTSFTFVVNAAGARQDWASANDKSYGDLSWDPVWEVAVRRDSAGESGIRISATRPRRRRCGGSIAAAGSIARRKVRTSAGRRKSPTASHRGLATCTASTASRSLGSSRCSRT
jgi:hypothetical protein